MLKDVELSNVQNIYMIGIGGVSMSGIAAILKTFGYNISGSDISESSNVEKLRKLGIPVTIGHNPENIKGADLVVYTAAIKENDIEFVEAKKLSIPVMERSTLLGKITKTYENTICVSGSHGKTTTTSMLSLCFLEAGLEPTIQVGADLKAIDGNYYIGNSDTFIIESCEYVESFLKFYPKSEIVLNIDNDHLDYFKDLSSVKHAFEKFVALMPEDGALVVNADDESCLSLKEHCKGKFITFGIENLEADFIAKNINLEENNGFAIFDVYKNNEYYYTFKLSVLGKHNVLNALSCIALCDFYGISKEHMQSAFEKFTGANRRFEFIGKYKDTVEVYDDYAHHPTEIKATAQALKHKKHNQNWVVFQSHTYSRTYNLFNEFIETLTEFDNIIITDIYAARETNIYDISEEDIVNELRKKGKNVIYISGYDNIVEYLEEVVNDGDLVITVGAGPVVEVAKKLIEKIEKNRKK